MPKSRKMAGAKAAIAAEESGRKSEGRRMVEKTEKWSGATRGVEPWTWKEVEPGRWLTVGKPEDDWCYPRVQRTFSRLKKTGEFGYHPYRNAELLSGALPTLEAAQRRAQSGEKDEKFDAVIEYVDHHPCDIPPFLALTAEERAAVRAQYPFAAPTQEQERRGVALAARARRGDAADLDDPSTRAFLEAEERRGGAGAGGQAGGGTMLTPSGRPSTRRGKKAALADPLARLSLVGAPANPAKPGSGRHARYQLIFDAAARGDTVAALLAAGGNEVTLGKCVARGHVEILPPGAEPEAEKPKAEKTEKAAEKPAKAKAKARKGKK